jgi:hypothetical protein
MDGYKRANKVSPSEAKKIGREISQDDLGIMFDNAKKGVSDWGKPSRVNNSFSTGWAWNKFYKPFILGNLTHNLAKRNAVWEFGEFLPEELKPWRYVRNKSKTPVHHEEPIF